MDSYLQTPNCFGSSADTYPRTAWDSSAPPSCPGYTTTETMPSCRKRSNASPRAAIVDPGRVRIPRSAPGKYPRLNRTAETVPFQAAGTTVARLA